MTACGWKRDCSHPQADRLAGASREERTSACSFGMTVGTGGHNRRARSIVPLQRQEQGARGKACPYHSLEAETSRGTLYADMVFERGPNHLAKTGKTVWLLQDVRAFFQQRNQKPCVRGVTGSKEHSNARPKSGYFQIGSRATHCRQHDIHN